MRFVTVVLSLTLSASAAHSFEVDISYKDSRKLWGRPILEELTVGVKARIGRWVLCQKGGALVVSEEAEIDPSGEFIISRNPTGTFSLVFAPKDYSDKRTIFVPSYQWAHYFNSCERQLNYDPASYTHVLDIDGFLTYSEWVRNHVLKHFQLKE